MKKIELLISHASLMGEVAKWSYTIGENVGDDNVKFRHFIQGAADSGHADLLRSVSDDAWSELLRVLSAYTVDGSCGCEGCTEYRCGCGDGSGTDKVNYEDGLGTDMCADYHVTLFFPDNTYPTLPSNIARLAKRYISLRIRAEWQTLTGQSSELMLAESERVIRRLIAEISTRTTVGKVKGKWRY